MSDAPTKKIIPVDKTVILEPDVDPAARPSPWWLTVLVLLLALAATWPLDGYLARGVLSARDVRAAVDAARSDLDQEIVDRQSLLDIVAGSLVRAKTNATRLTRSRRELFEGGLAVSEEKRLLDKQWEIMTTYLQLDVDADQIHVMRGDQRYETWPLAGAVPTAVGGEKRPMPKLATIISKELFAHPERGRSEVVAGRLEWEPPQVGQSARARALGESVLFTHEGLIIHGPPLDKAEHDAYPHLCLSLPAKTARRIYDRSFIGTRIDLRPNGNP